MYIAVIAKLLERKRPNFHFAKILWQNCSKHICLHLAPRCIPITEELLFSRYANMSRNAFLSYYSYFASYNIPLCLGEDDFISGDKNELPLFPSA